MANDPTDIPDLDDQGNPVVKPGTPAPAAKPAAKADDDELDVPLTEGGIKALNAERQARKAERDKAADLQRQLDAITAANLSKEEAAIKRAEAAEAKAKELEDAKNDRELRDSVATTKGVPAALLTGKTEAEMNASADLLIQHGVTSDGTPPPAHNPHLGQDQGDQGNEDAEALSILGF